MIWFLVLILGVVYKNIATYLDGLILYLLISIKHFARKTWKVYTGTLFSTVVYTHFSLRFASRWSTSTIKSHQTALWQSLNIDSPCKENCFAMTVAKQFFTQYSCLRQIPIGFSKSLPPSVLSPASFRRSLYISFVLSYYSATARCDNYCISSFFAALLNSFMLTQ